MTVSSKYLIAILLGGILWSIYRLVTAGGGAGLEEFIHGLVYTSLGLFVVSGIILVFQRKKLRDSIDELILFGISAVVTAIYIIDRFF